LILVTMECGQKAVLIVTMTPEGTATNVARQRLELVCSLPVGHAGKHRDEARREEWSAASGDVPMLLRHEDEAPGT
jgi:hypothetical protein